MLVAVLTCGQAWAEPCRRAPRRTSTELFAPGPHGVGVRTFTFVDAARATPPTGTFPGAAGRSLVTEVWYPALAGAAPMRDAPLDPAAAPYPLVLHSHALFDGRAGEAYLTAHLASHGFVVAALDFPLSHFGAPGGPTVTDLTNQPGDLRVVLDALLMLAAAETGPLARAIDPARVGASGLSLGALTTLLATHHATLRDPRLRAAFVMAPPYSCAFTRRFFRTARMPLLVLQGDADLMVPPRENGERVFRRARGPRHLVVLANGSHIGFVGFATGLDQGLHFDRFGCEALRLAVGDDFSPPMLPDETQAGISRDPDHCPEPCLVEPTDPALTAVRQHDLTRLVATAFFAAALAEDRGAGCFLRRQLARENSGVLVRSRRR
jgi:predicted dienelactone hydrolase